MGWRQDCRAPHQNSVVWSSIYCGQQTQVYFTKSIRTALLLTIFGCFHDYFKQIIRHFMWKNICKRSQQLWKYCLSHYFSEGVCTLSSLICVGVLSLYWMHGLEIEATEWSNRCVYPSYLILPSMLWLWCSVVPPSIIYLSFPWATIFIYAFLKLCSISFYILLVEAFSFVFGHSVLSLTPFN